VHISPDETDALAHIPAGVLFPAPRLPRGHVLLGYDEHGSCPMLVDDKCSVYAHRPRACRAYDCRIFAATEVEPDKPLIASRAALWRFDISAPADETLFDALGAAARFLHDKRHLFPAGSIPTSPTQLAVLAIEIHDLFIKHGDTTAESTVVEPELATVETRLTRLDLDRTAPGR
jgi:uncharacterized protein